MHYPDKKDLELNILHAHTLHARIEVKTFNGKTYREIQGNLISDNFSYDRNSDIRSTYSLNLVVNEELSDFVTNKTLWMASLFDVSIGYELPDLDTIKWYSMGTYAASDISFESSAQGKRFSVKLSDKVALLNGERNGYITATSELVIPAYKKDEKGFPIKDENGRVIYNTLRSAVSHVINDIATIQKTVIDIDEKDNIIPYDLEFEKGTTVWDIVKTLRDLYTGYEAFFDEDVFVFRKIPTFDNDPVVLDSEKIAPLVISGNVSNNLNDVFNIAEIWGKDWDTDCYIANSEERPDISITYDSGKDLYSLITDAITELKDGTLVGFKSPAANTAATTAGTRIKITTTKGTLLTPEDGVQVINGMKDNSSLDFISKGKIQKDRMYVLKFVNNSTYAGYFIYQGEYQISAVNKLVSVEPSEEDKQIDAKKNFMKEITYTIDRNNPFTTDKIGEVRKVFSNGEYDSIETEKDCEARAKYEVWKGSYLRDTLSLTTILIPWLRPNQKIEYDPIGEKGSVPQQYIVDSISGSSLNGTMDIKLVKFMKEYYWNK